MASQRSVAGSHPMTLRNASRALTRSTGNEKADQEAKAAAALAAAAAPHDGSATLAYMRRQIKEQAMKALKKYWAQNAPKRYIELEIPLQKAPAEMKLPRFTLGKLYAARTGHGDFAEYHTRWQHEDAECYCRRGSRKGSEHFYYCRLARRATVQRQRPTYSFREMLATPQGVQGFHSWIKETAFYRDICPMRKLPTTASGLQPNIPLHSSSLSPSIPSSTPSAFPLPPKTKLKLFECCSHKAPTP
ncbi:hypothetical protein VTO42DRAFT_373 [Malbranchea cinnamomea]